MKTSLHYKYLLLLAFFTLSSVVSQRVEAQPGVSVSFETFYHELSPYGQWIDDRNLGFVWLPDVGRDFHPYMTNGYWVMTEYGNTWVSNYDWGWAPFHYGRWRFDDYYGWMWVPGTEWGPAWVAWRNGGGYYGWAPLGPGVNINISVNIGRYIPNSYWTFVQHRHFMRPNVFRYCAPRPHITRIINQTTIINNTYVYNDRHTYYTGPQVHDIERYTRQRVRVHRVNHVDQRGRSGVRNGTVSVYQPARSNRDVNVSRSRGRTNYSGSRANVSRGRSSASPYNRESYNDARQSRGRSYGQNTETVRNYRSERKAVEGNRNNRSYGNSRESSYRRESSRGNQESYSPGQRSSRGASPQRYGNTHENTNSRSRHHSTVERSSTSRSSAQFGRSGRSSSSYQRGGDNQRIERSRNIGRSSGSRSSATNGRSSRNNSSYQHESRSTASPARSGSTKGSENESRGRSSRSTRGGGN
ncbi:MAG: DUF6600 domain-containing protein [Cyclobacteriaceae bacterium]